MRFVKYIVSMCYESIISKYISFEKDYFEQINTLHYRIYVIGLKGLIISYFIIELFY